MKNRFNSCLREERSAKDDENNASLFDKYFLK